MSGESFTARLRRELQARQDAAQTERETVAETEREKRERRDAVNAELRAQIEKARGRNRWVVDAW